MRGSKMRGTQGGEECSAAIVIRATGHICSKRGGRRHNTKYRGGVIASHARIAPNVIFPSSTQQRR